MSSLEMRKPRKCKFSTLRGSLTMNEAENIKDFMTRLVKVMNQIKLLRGKFLESRIVEKVLVVLPERFEPKISSIEESKDLSIISLTKQVNVLQAQEQRRLLKHEETTNFALKKYVGENSRNDSKRREKFSSGICKRTNHKESDCWCKGKTPSSIQCRYCKQNGHIERFCRLKQQQQNKKKK